LKRAPSGTWHVFLVQATLPHKGSGPGVSTFERSNGNFHVLMIMVSATVRSGLREAERLFKAA